MLSDVSPRKGMVALPLAPVVGCTNGCVCVSWCRSAHHVSWLFASAPSSASVALPAKLSVSPARKVAPAAGRVIVATGAALLGALSSPPHAVTAATANRRIQRTLRAASCVMANLLGRARPCTVALSVLSWRACHQTLAAASQGDRAATPPLEP